MHDNNEKFTSFPREREKQKCAAHIHIINKYTHIWPMLQKPLLCNTTMPYNRARSTENHRSNYLAYFVVELFFLIEAYLPPLLGSSLIAAVDKIKRWLKPPTKRVNVGTLSFCCLLTTNRLTCFTHSNTQLPLTKKITLNTEQNMFLPNFDHFYPECC